MENILSKFIPRLHNRGSAYFWTYLITLHLWDLSICHSVPPCHSADGNSRCLTFPRVPTLPPSLPPSIQPPPPPPPWLTCTPKYHLPSCCTESGTFWCRGYGAQMANVTQRRKRSARWPSPSCPACRSPWCRCQIWRRWWCLRGPGPHACGLCC